MYSKLMFTKSIEYCVAKSRTNAREWTSLWGLILSLSRCLRVFDLLDLLALDVLFKPLSTTDQKLNPHYLLITSLKLRIQKWKSSRTKHKKLENISQ